MPNIEEIYQVCTKYSGSGYFVGENIPDKRLNNALAHMKVPTNDRVISLIDTTLTGSAKHGLAICESGLYWSNNWTTKSTRTHLSWNEFSTVSIRIGNDITESEIELGEGNLLNTAGSFFEKEKTLQLLKELQYLCKYTTNSQDKTVPRDNFSPPPLPSHDDAEWFLGISGQQTGPYSLAKLAQLVNAGQININDTLVWRQGMSSWILFIQHEELLQNLKSLQRPNTPPPFPMR